MKPGGKNRMVVMVARTKRSEKTVAERIILNLAGDEFGDMVCHHQGYAT
jgi:hypothetical protein